MRGMTAMPPKASAPEAVTPFDDATADRTRVPSPPDRPQRNPEPRRNSAFTAWAGAVDASRAPATLPPAHQVETKRNNITEYCFAFIPVLLCLIEIPRARPNGIPVLASGSAALQVAFPRSTT